MPDQTEIETIDWELVKKRLSGSLESLWGWYLPVVVFITPLLIVTYSYPAPVIRQLALFTLVGLGWLIWLGRVLLSDEAIVWQRSALGWGALAVALAALISTFASGNLAATWGLRGALADSSPLAWLALTGLAMLIVQETKGRQDRLLRVLFGYLAASSLLVLFTIGWWIFRQELITPALNLFTSAALWFAVNTLVLSAASLFWGSNPRLASGRARLVCLILIILHIVVLFGYDYDLAWYVLAGGGVLLSVGQLLLEKRLPRVDFRLSFGLIIVSVALLFVPAKALSPKLGFDITNTPVASTGLIWPRYYQNIIKSDPVFGVGLGGAVESFWSLAELVDMRQVRQFPNLGNGFLVILWEGGLALALAFIFWLFCLARAFCGSLLKRRVADSGSVQTESALALCSFLALVGLLVSFAVLPVDFMFIFSLSVFIGVLGALFSRGRIQIAKQKGVRSFLVFGAALLSVFLLAVMIGSIREARGRLDFLDSIVTDKSGTSIDLGKMDSAISGHRSVYGYRLGRIDFFTQALIEGVTKNPDFKPEQASQYLTSLQSDFEALANARLSGREQWLLAWNAEQIGAVLRQLPKAEGQTEDKGKEWFVRARALYESGLASFPRNVILFTDVARFYRMRSADILKEGETADALYRQAHALLDRVLAVDGTYEQSFVERAELLSIEGKSEEAFTSLKPLADQNPAASYSVGHLAFAAKKFDEAVAYLKKAIEQNPNHLQARYELVQAYLALADKKSAAAELTALEEKAPKDDAATQTLLKGLGELLK